MKRPTHVLSVLALLVLAPGARTDSLNGLRSSVARVGDVNGDGVPDLAVASRDRDRPESVWILSGKDGAKLLEIKGRASGDGFGTELRGVGDWDRDGAPDLAVTARRPQGRDGYRRIVSGRAGTTLLEFESPGAIGGTRDLDGDGTLDLLLTVEEEGGRTATVVVSGRTGSHLVRAADSSSTSFRHGTVVEELTWLDDVDRDGRCDFAMATSSSRGRIGPVETSNSFTVVSGRTGTSIWTAEPESGGDSGIANVVESGDANADGIGDVLCSLEDRTVRLRDGRNGTVLWTRKLPYHVLYSLGSSLDRVEDLDGDKIDDWVIAANESWSDMFDDGLCYVASGKTGETIRSLCQDPNFGFDVCGLGDVNGDDVPDFAVGAERQRGWTPDDGSEPAVQVRSGKDASILWMRRHVDLRR